MSDNYDPIISGLVGKMGNTISAMCQNLDIAMMDPEAKELADQVLKIQTELMLMKMEDTDPDDIEMVEGALISASQSLKASVSIDLLNVTQKAWRKTIGDIIGTIVKLI